MSFIVNKVIVNNFRTHKSFQFEPNDSGVTVIKGANGTGKSSLVDSIAWGLFGIKPPGVGKNGDLRRKDMGDKEKCFVEVTIKTVSGIVYKIQRRIVGKKGSTECDVWVITEGEDDDGNVVNVSDHVAGASVSHAAEFLRSHLGVTEKGFLASMFVQQKQVDELITASPKERSVVIEKMTGITALTEAASEIRAEVNDAKKTVEVLSANAENFDVEELKTTLDNYKTDKDKVENNLSDLTIIGKKKKSELNNEQDKYNTISGIIRKIENSENDMKNLNNQVSFVTSTISELDNDVDNKQSELNSMSGADNDESINNIRIRYESLGKDVRENERNIDRVTTEVSRARKLMSGYIAHKNELAKLGIIFTKENFGEESVTNAIKTLNDNHNNLLKDNDKILVEINKLAEQELNIKFILDTNNQTLKALDNEHGECPTCHQKPDNANELLENIRKVITDSKTTIQQIRDNKKEIENAHSSHKNDATILENMIVELQNTLTYIPILEELKSELSTNESKTNTLKKQFEEVKELHNNLLRIESLRESIESDNNKINNQKNQIIDYKNQLKEIESQIGNLNSELDLYPDIKTVETNISLINAELDDLRTSVFTNREEKSNLELKIQYTEKDLNRAITGADEYKKAVEKLEKITAASSVVSSFREKRIEEVIPEISFIASDLLQRFTAGKFIGVELDSSYRAKVQLPNGDLRDTGLLSGGELSAVALSLRLAIALLSYGDSTGVTTMILDEVLVSQDEDRVESIISTMKEVLQGQVILIGHNGDVISSIADNVVELTHSQ